MRTRVHQRHRGEVGHQERTRLLCLVSFVSSSLHSLLAAASGLQQVDVRNVQDEERSCAACLRPLHFRVALQRRGPGRSRLHYDACCFQLSRRQQQSGQLSKLQYRPQTPVIFSVRDEQRLTTAGLRYDLERGCFFTSTVKTLPQTLLKKKTNSSD